MCRVILQNPLGRKLPLVTPGVGGVKLSSLYVSERPLNFKPLCLSLLLNRDFILYIQKIFYHCSEKKSIIQYLVSYNLGVIAINYITLEDIANKHRGYFCLSYMLIKH